MIRALMRTIEELERTWPDDPAESSFHPLLPPIATRSTSINSQSTVVSQRTTKSPWLPCHYFDYIAGTSTGGYASSKLVIISFSSQFIQHNQYNARTFADEY